MMVSDDKAKSDNLKIGDVLTVNLTGLGELPLTIVGTYSSDELAGKYVVSRSLYADTSGSYFDFSVFINTAPGVSACAGRGGDRAAGRAVRDRASCRAEPSTSTIRPAGSTSCWR